MKRALVVFLLVIAFAASCKPDFGERESLVDRTRVLAVEIEADVDVVELPDLGRREHRDLRRRALVVRTRHRGLG